MSDPSDPSSEPAPDGKSARDADDQGVQADSDGVDSGDAHRTDTQSEDSTHRGDAEEDADLESLRAAVEEKYDFENFRPADMAEMTAEEWEAAFDPDTWITGTDLLDRVERDLRNRIATRDVFAVLERSSGPDRVIAYSDEGYAIVHPDGSVEGEGTVLRDVKPTVALCSMDSYEVPEPPEEYELPTPREVEAGTGEFGNLMLQVVAAVQVLGGLGLGLAWVLGYVSTIVAPVGAGFFLLTGVFLFAVVANARLSDRFRAEEYRDRLRAAGIAGDDEPVFVPFEQVRRELERAETTERDAPDAPSNAAPSGGDRDPGGTGETTG